jgi:rod shape-determining protein MreD
MSLTRHRGGWVIAMSFIISMILTMLPLPGSLEIFRPEWVTLTLIYWCMALPARVGVGIGFTVGLFLDVIRDTLLGQYALALTLIAFITLHLHQRVRVFPLWQQAVSIFILVMLESVVVLWVKGIIGESVSFWNLIATAGTSMIAWPFVFVVLRHVRRTYQVS